ncbi:uncharacterized protein EV420DRAFT_1768506 [Desarmillaria tabescens]|uniref:Uncharacterized protein n=1 Tax=Armillaria tabescens TaxID=1929756 RepID=A0AA39JLL7_ARMTA|nr:uncharacterized protein EV420DRAFT_1768506 [Desarmillaria tabescens]KAK0443996.1 hypothetical protein EV420DRAFT_1768506 [Desarmillaria tabescens]
MQAPDLSASQGPKFLFQQENGEIILRPAHPQQDDQLCPTGARRHHKDLEGRLRDVEVLIANHLGFQERIRESQHQEKYLALHYGTAERFSRGITDDLLSTNPEIEYYILRLSQAISRVSVQLGRTMIYMPNILVAWYYHRAITSSSSHPPYPTLTQQLPPHLHQRNIAAAEALEQISVFFDLKPLSYFALSHIEKVSLLVDTRILHSILSNRSQLLIVPRADVAWDLLLEQNRMNSSHKDVIQTIMSSLIDVLKRSGGIEYFAS